MRETRADPHGSRDTGVNAQRHDNTGVSRRRFSDNCKLARSLARVRISEGRRAVT